MLVTQGSKRVLIGLEVREFEKRRAEWQVFPRCKKVILAKKWSYKVLTRQRRYEPMCNKTYNKTCVTSKDSNQPVHPLSMPMGLFYPSLDSLEAIAGTDDQRRH